MSRRVELVLVCEDQQHGAFLTRFLKNMGWSNGKLRVIQAPPGKGSAEQFVRTNFPLHLKEHRRRRNHVRNGLVVMMDGDAAGVDARIAALDAACRNAAVQPRQPEDRAAILIPTWCIETWLAYLDGEDVDEARPDYPRLPRAKDCRMHVDALATMCHQGELRAPAPRSLKTACGEIRTRVMSPV